MKDTFKTISTASEGYFKDRGSKFISYAFPVQSEEDIKDILNRIKKEHHSARHHCFAWRIGADEPVFRINDDGEPSFTAGKPILGQILSFEVTNIFLVVVRYFGGTLLGTGGLINAYKSAARDALQNAKIITKTIEDSFNLKFPYKKMNPVMHIIKQENLNIANTRFELECSLNFSVRKGDAERIKNLFHALPDVEIKKMQEK